MQFLCVFVTPVSVVCWVCVTPVSAALQENMAGCLVADKLVEHLAALVHKLPPSNFRTCAVLMHHLHRYFACLCCLCLRCHAFCWPVLTSRSFQCLTLLTFHPQSGQGETLSVECNIRWKPCVCLCWKSRPYLHKSYGKHVCAQLFVAVHACILCVCVCVHACALVCVGV